MVPKFGWLVLSILLINYLDILPGSLMANELERLKARRAGYRSAVTRLLHEDLPTDAGEILGCVNKVDRYSSLLSELDSQISTLIDDFDIETDITDACDYQDKLSVLRGRLQAAQTVENDTASSVTAGGSPKCHARLPKLEIASFDGNPLQWTSFWDTFESAVDSNEDLKPIDKFNYLKSLIKGAAASAVAGFATTAANYSQAISILKERFGQKRIVVNAHIEALLAVPVAQNFKRLRETFDEAERHIRGLEALGVTADTYGIMMAPILLSKVPPDVRLVLSRLHGESVWELSRLREQLGLEIAARERSQVTDSKPPRDSNRDYKPAASSLVASTKPLACAFCAGRHVSSGCTLKIDDRWEKAKANKLCFMCLRSNHVSQRCRFRKKCSTCGRMHHISLCSGPNQHVNFEKQSTEEFQADKDTKTSQASCLNAQATPFLSKTCPALLNSDDSVLMQTALVKINGYQERVRVLFDSGSERSFICQELVNRLGLKASDRETLAIAVFNADSSSPKKYDVVKLNLQCTDHSPFPVTAVVVPSITSPLRRAQIRPEDLSYLQGLPLADPPTDTSDTMCIDVLIGLDYYWDLIGGGTRKLPSGPTAIKSRFGWLISGVIKGQVGAIKSQSRSCRTLFIGMDTLSFDDQLQQFWELESLGIAVKKVEDDVNSKVLKNFENSVYFDKGRYQVRFPWKEDLSCLGNNRALAKNRFDKLVFRLQKDQQLMNDYGKIISDQLERKFIEPVPDEEVSNGFVHYIAHHPVVREGHQTTKVRIVYDASARVDRHTPSLNDCMHAGPDMIGDLFAILLRFRQGEIALISDIEKAFLQVGLQEVDRDCTRFFWIDQSINKEKPDVKVFRFVRVPFGIISSPFLLNATIQHHLSLYGNEPFPTMIKNSLYVDNAIVSLDGIGNGIDYYKTAKRVFREAGMNLREWSTNSSEVLETIPTEDRAKGDFVKILGISWNIKSDSLQVREPSIGKEGCVVSKRTVLRTISTIFDPIGLCSSATIAGKIFMQTLWKRELDWDTQLPDDLLNAWTCILEGLQGIGELQCPRCLNLLNTKEVQLHVFADASPRAYAAAVYARVLNLEDTIDVNLVCSKARVAPIKDQTLPRLELLAVLIAVRLVESVQTNLTVPIEKIFVWSDSQIVLSWIKSSKTLNQFIANRISEIRKLKAVFGYVPSKENPADLPSRGVPVSTLKPNTIWWKGPMWLRRNDDTWPKQSAQTLKIESAETAEIEKDVVVFITAEHMGLQCSDFSSLTKLVRVTAWCMRFIARLKGVQERKSYLTTKEIEEATSIWVRIAQKESFGREIAGFRSKTSTSLAKQLNLFLDKDGFIRCKGRLEFALVDTEVNCPRLLPKNHPFTALVIRHVHTSLLHQGVRHTLTALRHTYWIPQGRQAVKRELKMCPVCRKWEGKAYVGPSPAPLPADRVTESHPFECTGVDFAGPLFTKEEKKVWICLYTCAVTRAIHLELTRDMTTFEFLLCFRRFVARRGVPRRIISDNAKTFKLAKKTLNEIWSDVVESSDVQDYVTNLGLKWTFNVERAPWWGGFFERMVGLVKRTLRKVLGKAHYSYVELETQLIEVEAILNSRPLTFIYSSPDEGHALTPNDLCGLKPRTGFPVVPVEDDPSFVPTSGDCVMTLTRRIKRHQDVLEKFWATWKHEYLTQLREYRTSQRTSQENKAITPTVGSVVLIKENLPRAQWKIGVISKCLVGKDGQIRAAVVKTRNGKTLQRPLQLLFPLEVSSQHEDDPAKKVKEGTNEAQPDRPVSRRKCAIDALKKINSQLS